MCTSPNLDDIGYRIRLDMLPIRKELFAKYFFERWDPLTRSPDGRPRYLQLLSILVVHTVIKEGVDAAIIETHHGGEYDATNVIQRPVGSSMPRGGARLTGSLMGRIPVAELPRGDALAASKASQDQKTLIQEFTEIWSQLQPKSAIHVSKGANDVCISWGGALRFLAEFGPEEEA
ncbi:folylpolyglutamate synthase [Apiospora arundinis]